MNNDITFMHCAIELAQQAAADGEVPVGAVLVKDNQIIAEASNQPIHQCDPTAHAEVNVLRAAAKQLGNYRLLNSTLYVTLEPCAMCVGALLHARVQRLVFGAYDQRAGAVASVFQLLDDFRLTHRPDYQGGVLQPECLALLQEFFQARR